MSMRNDGGDDDRSIIWDIFRRLNLVPSVLNTQPKELLKVDYGDGPNAIRGNRISPGKLRYMPLLSWNIKPATFYAMIMVDVDAPLPLRPIFAEYQHWVVVNIPGNSVVRGDSLRDYVPPCPPRASGVHRILISVFKQPNWILYKEQHIPAYAGKLRSRFSTKDFAKKYNLELVAANAFVVEWDPFVPLIHKEIRKLGK